MPEKPPTIRMIRLPSGPSAYPLHKEMSEVVSWTGGFVDDTQTVEIPKSQQPPKPLESEGLEGERGLGDHK